MNLPTTSPTHAPRYAQATLAATLQAGTVYRREDFVPFTNAVDRHLRALVDEGALTKIAPGLYYAPKKSAFGPLPPDDEKLIEAFLRDKHFLIFSVNAYHSAGLGTTQLSNQTLVYNHKRHGVFTLGNRRFDFRVKPRFPRSLSPEFVFVDALNNIAQLGEGQEAMLAQAQQRTPTFDAKILRRVVEHYGNGATKKRVNGWLNA